MYGKCDVDMIERKIWQKTKITNETQYSWAHLDNIEHSIFQFENRFHVNRCVCAPHLRNENVWKIPNKGRQKTLRFHIIIFTLPTHTRTNAHTQRIMCVINIFVLHWSTSLFVWDARMCVTVIRVSVCTWWHVTTGNKYFCASFRNFYARYILLLLFTVFIHICICSKNKCQK